MNLQKTIRRILKEETRGKYIFVRYDKFSNRGTKRKLPYKGIQCWCIYEDDLDKYITELELWDGDRKYISIIDGEGYDKYALDYTKTHNYVMGNSDVLPELEKFNPNKHIMRFHKKPENFMLEYVADMKYQIILTNEKNTKR
jgi:hypothetical protein